MNSCPRRGCVNIACQGRERSLLRATQAHDKAYRSRCARTVFVWRCVRMASQVALCENGLRVAMRKNRFTDRVCQRSALCENGLPAAMRKNGFTGRVVRGRLTCRDAYEWLASRDTYERLRLADAQEWLSQVALRRNGFRM